MITPPACSRDLPCKLLSKVERSPSRRRQCLGARRKDELMASGGRRMGGRRGRCLRLLLQKAPRQIRACTEESTELRGTHLAAQRPSPPHHTAGQGGAGAAEPPLPSPLLVEEAVPVHPSQGTRFMVSVPLCRAQGLPLGCFSCSPCLCGVLCVQFRFHPPHW